MKNYLIVIFILLLTSTLCFADITFTDGKWETTFDCDDWTWAAAGTCDELTLTGAGEGGTMTNHTSITIDANNPSGHGGKGIRYWVNDGDDVLSAGIYANMPTAQKTLWVRFYTRWESGFRWKDNDLLYSKLLYIRTYPTGDPSAIPGLVHNDVVIAPQGTSASGVYPRGVDKGWGYIYPDIVDLHNVSDGSWHCFEFYIKMNLTNSSEDGEGRIWIDGVLVAENLIMNYNGSTVDALDGFIHILFRSNQNWPDNGKEMYIDYDDMVIYNTTPPNTDADGNAYIGMIQSTAPIQGITITGGTIE